MLKKAIAVLILGLVVIIYLVVPLFLSIDSDQRLSAWDNGFDDTDTIRIQVEEMNEMTRQNDLGYDEPRYKLSGGYDVRSIVTSPTILSIDSIDPENTVYIVTGLEQPYSQEGIDGLIEYTKAGGHAIIADKSENIRGLAATFGITMYPGKFFDESYDKNSSFTMINANLGVDLRTPKYIPNDVIENQLINGNDIPEADGIWDDDTDGDGKIDEDQVESKFISAVDDDKDMGKIINDGRDNDNDWVIDDGGYDEN